MSFKRFLFANDPHRDMQEPRHPVWIEINFAGQHANNSQEKDQNQGTNRRNVA